MAVLSVDKVFRFAKFVSNKESKGWVDPPEFNIAAELAQIAVYSKLENGFIANKKIQSDMRPFLASETIVDATPRVFPTAFRQLINARVVTTNAPVVELTQAELNDILDSQFLTPSAAYPNCVVRSDGIQVYPATVTQDVIVEYIKKLSTAPLWDYTLTSDRPVYDASGSTQFEFEDNLFLEIAMLVLSNIGMNIGKENLAQYGAAFNPLARTPSTRQYK